MNNLTKNELIPLPMSAVHQLSQAYSDIYIQMSEQKFILLFRQGQTIEEERVKNYSTKKVEHFYIPKTEFQNFSENMLNSIESQIDSHSPLKNKPLWPKIFTLAEILLGEVFQREITQQSLQQLDHFCDLLISSLGAPAPIHDLISIIKECDSHLYRHSIATASFVLCIAKGLGWRNQKNLKLLSSACLLHDLGFRYLTPGLHLKPSDKMNQRELDEYQLHPQIGANKLREIDPNQVELITIIEQHHEKPNANGFPNQLNKESIYPPVGLVRMADELAKLLFISPKNPEPLDYKSAIKVLERRGAKDYPSEYWAGLYRAFQ